MTRWQKYSARPVRKSSYFQTVLPREAKASLSPGRSVSLRGARRAPQKQPPEGSYYLAIDTRREEAIRDHQILPRAEFLIDLFLHGNGAASAKCCKMLRRMRAVCRLCRSCLFARHVER